MKKTYILSLILIIGLGVWWFTKQGEKNEIEALSTERDFGIKNVKDIARVELTYKDRDKCVIEKKGKTWFVNDTIEAWDPTIKGFIGTLRDLTLQYTPPKTAKAHIEDGMDKFGIGVEVFDKNGNELKGYTIGGVTPGENGTYAKMNGSEKPFVVHIKFSEGALRKQFDRSVEEWRNRFIFQEEWEEITKVTVDYPKFPSRSFVIQKEKDQSYSVLRPTEPVGESRIKLLRGEAEAYLMHFEELGIEAFENDHKQRDSILQLQPYVNLSVLKDDGELKWLKLFPLNHVSGEIDLSEGYANSGQLFRFLGDYSSGDFIMIQHFTIGNTLRKYDDFKK